ncbi:copper chaperone PCu(A)C [Kitasatospora sp. NBC_01287]|uniref:copper chaperone PCu(A)C n=1 Tax=Kitasatospora sp. NBC_01287 TaxID=2903573 RepID=UPI00224E5BDB|nr:copper chaperone PCu(A)C [Kitasatospora sp. NBC_01287]MCX4747881.1 copper chaperone PCu(A)C [Kitasatospora sp. NBC_01287]
MPASREFRRTALAGAAVAAALTVSAIVVAGAGGHDASAKLSVTDSYIPLPAAGTSDSMAAGYLTVRNTGGAADTLVRVSSPGAGSISMHRSTDTSMDEVDSLPVPAGGTLRLARGGLHLMIMGWQKQPAVGDRLELDLHFAHGGTIVVQVPVQPLTYRPGS